MKLFFQLILLTNTRILLTYIVNLRFLNTVMVFTYSTLFCINPKINFDFEVWKNARSIKSVKSVNIRVVNEFFNTAKEKCVNFTRKIDFYIDGLDRHLSYPCCRRWYTNSQITFWVSSWVFKVLKINITLTSNVWYVYYKPI